MTKLFRCYFVSHLHAQTIWMLLVRYLHDNPSDACMFVKPFWMPFCGLASWPNFLDSSLGTTFTTKLLREPTFCYIHGSSLPSSWNLYPLASWLIYLDAFMWDIFHDVALLSNCLCVTFMTKLFEKASLYHHHDKALFFVNYLHYHSVWVVLCGLPLWKISLTDYSSREALRIPFCGSSLPWISLNDLSWIKFMTKLFECSFVDLLHNQVL